MSPKLYRVILPVSNIDRAEAFYRSLLQVPGQRVSPGRHYFDCGGTILACYDPRADGESKDAQPNPEHLYFAVEDLELTFAHAQTVGCQALDKQIKTQTWGERCFNAVDPFGNHICFVDARTLFTGQYFVSSHEPLTGTEGDDAPIEVLDLGVRTYNCLKRSNIATVRQLLALRKTELLNIRNFGTPSYEEVRERLIARGFMHPLHPLGPFAEEDDDA